jgi:hypothetical protein
MLLKRLECQASKLVNSDTFPRPTTDLLEEGVEADVLEGQDVVARLRCERKRC